METSAKAQPKELARIFIRNRIDERKPLPSMREIRRQLGWDMLKVSPAIR